MARRCRNGLATLSKWRARSARDRPHPRVYPDGYGIEGRVDAHPPLPRRLLGSIERLLHKLEARRDDQVLDLAGEL
jgi:hypothetical protein